MTLSPKPIFSHSANRELHCSAYVYRSGPEFSSLSESPMPIKSQAINRPNPSQCGMMLRQRYEEVGFPCWKTIASPPPYSM